MARLGRSLAKLRIDNPLSREQWLERCRKLSPPCASTAAPPTSWSTSR